VSSYYSYERPELVAEVPQGTQRLLDIGCGEGAMSAAIRRDRGVREIWGVEIVEDVAEKARKNPAIDRFLAGNIEELVHDLPESYFDCIVAGDVLEHLVDPWATLAELRKRLKPGGRIISSIPNIRNFSFLAQLVFGGRFRYKESGVMDRTHLRFFARKDMVDLFAGAGFEGVRVSPARKKGALKQALRVLLGDFITKVFLITATCAASDSDE
jgi:2-polyprenyl-3-methyl-5-hydroxy-6-metoxy-1,4-benzoquinol methylase